MDIDALVAFLREEEARSYDPVLADHRAFAIDFYNGELFGDEEDGRSQVVTRDVAEVIDHMTISTWRTMISGDRVVEFECGDKDVANQATIAVGREFYQGQRGADFLHAWIKAGLLEKSGVAKVCVEPQPDKRIEATLSIDELTLLTESGANVIETEPADEFEETFHVAWLEQQPPTFRDYAVPNEQFSFAQDAQDLDDDNAYTGFHNVRTLSALKTMGFETEGLGDNLATAYEQNSLVTARDGGLNANALNYNRAGANRRVVHHEEYVRFDLNEDGISELMLVHRVGNTILRKADTDELAIEVIDEQPGVVWCPFPMQHRIVGQSLADKCMDIQRVSSVLLRQALDNLYQSNSPRWTVSEGSIGDTTIDDLLTTRVGGLIRHVGAMPPVPVSLPFSAQSAFDALEIMRGEKESRTGVTRMNQGLDADALNKTASGTGMMMAAGQQIEDYVARNFAEAFARLMLKKYRLMRKFGKPIELVIDGKTEIVDPRAWPEDMKVAVRVGLGTGRKDQRIGHRMQLLEIAAQTNKAGMPVMNADNIYANLKGLVADMGLGSSHELLTDPATVEPQPPPPDPRIVKAQADATVKAEAVKATSRKHQADALTAIEKQRADERAAQTKALVELTIAREKMAHEREIEEARDVRDVELAMIKAGPLPDTRIGGELDE